MGIVSDKGNLIDLLRRTLEIAMPDMRHYYRVVKKAKVVAVYPAGGQYFADVQPLRNDGTVDENEPVAPKVEIPVMWAGPQRGVVCPPQEGTLCDLSYYDGDPLYPTITNFRHAGDAPAAELGEFVIQLEPGVEIRIDKEKQVVTLTPENVNTKAGKGWTVECGEHARINAGGNVEVSAAGNAEIQASGHITLTAPQIFQNGNVTTKGKGGGSGTVTETANRTQTGSLTVNGPVSINGTVAISGPLSVSGGIDGKVNGCSGC